MFIIFFVFPQFQIFHNYILFLNLLFWPCQGNQNLDQLKQFLFPSLKVIKQFMNFVINVSDVFFIEYGGKIIEKYFETLDFAIVLPQKHFYVFQ